MAAVPPVNLNFDTHGIQVANSQTVNKIFSVQARAIVLSGLVLLLALVWNTTFELLFVRFFGPKDRFIIQLIYAILLTAIIFSVLYLVTKHT